MNETVLLSRKSRFLFLLACLLGSLHLPARQIIKEGKEVPPFILKDVKGASYSSELLKNRVGVIMFARPGQKRSAAALKSMVTAGSEISQPAMEFIVIFSGEISRSSIEELCSEVGFKGKILLDPDMSVYGKFGVIVTPSIVIRGYDRKVAFSKAGYDFEFEKKWFRVTQAEYQRLLKFAQRGQPTLLDHYGATNQAEFFAVATECFFTQPHALAAEHEKLHGVLVRLFGQDPRDWLPRLEERATG